MANVFTQTSHVADAALGTLYASTPLPAIVGRNYESDFGFGRGDTVNVRKPAVFNSELFNRANGITIQDISEDKVPVVLEFLRNASVAVTDEQLVLDIEDFNEQVTSPLAEAIMQDLNTDIITKILASGAESVTGAEASAVLAGARGVLGRNKVPMAMRNAVVNPEAGSLWVVEDQFSNADKSGNTAAFREGQIGSRVYGFDVYETASLDGPAAAGFAFHETGVELTCRPLAPARGAAASETSEYKGLSLRATFGYDIHKKQTVLSLDMLYGITIMDSDRIVLLTETP